MLFVARESLISPLLAGRLDVDFMGWGARVYLSREFE